ncbi:MAG: PIN domain-containing protein [Pontiellaceae bacterium]|nr:PIN domain-containing protein [Pontiellaceae bacterium]
MNVLVDSSVWIDYFRGGLVSSLDWLIEENLICINELILAELVPFLRVRRQRKLIELLGVVLRLPLVIDWSGVIDLQVKCLHSGINKVGIPDLIIAQNAIQHDAPLYSLNKHFQMISTCAPLKLLGEAR